MFNPFSAVVNLINKKGDDFHKYIVPDPTEERIQKDFNDVRRASIIAAAVLAGSIALGILGIALASTGFVGAGVPLIFVSLPIAFLAYNAYQISQNTYDIVLHPRNYQNILQALTLNYDSEKVKVQLRKNTIGLDWAFDAFFDNL